MKVVKSRVDKELNLDNLYNNLPTSSYTKEMNKTKSDNRIQNMENFIDNGLSIIYGKLKDPARYDKKRDQYYYKIFSKQLIERTTGYRYYSTAKKYSEIDPRDRDQFFESLFKLIEDKGYSVVIESEEIFSIYVN